MPTGPDKQVLMLRMILVADPFEKIRVARDAAAILRRAGALAVYGQLVVGGSGRRIEVYDYSANRFAVSGGSLEDEWVYATATPLQDGRVFIAGGYNDSLYPTKQTWIYQPPYGAKTKRQ